MNNIIDHNRRRGIAILGQLACATALAGCAALTPEGQIAKLQDKTITEFINIRFPIREGTSGQPQGMGEYVAYFNQANSSDLYEPKREFGIFCQEKNGTLSVVETSKANPISGTPLPPATAINSNDERKLDRDRLLVAYEAAAHAGAIGTIRCTDTGSNRTLWTVSIRPGKFIRESATNLLDTNKLSMSIDLVAQ